MGQWECAGTGYATYSRLRPPAGTRHASPYRALRRWSSAYCSPARPAFRSYTRASPTDVLAGASRRAVAAMEILLSRRHTPSGPAGAAGASDSCSCWAT
ncbi:Os05g0201900 [Oryza sativa Japonica Group]|uniref:Os05g0201900 protein n=1 Tax=Oryza sativa subsp. japonica TaxID=39947 RepID=A0A0P0WIZ2_ORYSJ|nr:Os05g0201900 [Oryza sativa Japonica Group]